MSWQTDGDEHLQYSARDSAITARVWEGLRRDAKDDALAAKLYGIHRELSRIAAEMHSAGIYVHRDWWQFMQTCALQERDEAEEKMKAAAGIEVHPTDDVMRALLYKRHARDGLPCANLPDPADKRMWTDEARDTIKVDANSLLLLRASTDLDAATLKTIGAWATYQKKKKRYSAVRATNDKGKPTKLAKAIGPDGRLRAGWNSCGTDTMRFSCRDPNVMQYEQILRHMFAPAPGNVIIHADKRQLEIRVMAVVAADMVLMDAIDGGDVYSAEACDYFGRDLATFDPDGNKADKNARKAAKIIRLARQYGAGKQTVFMQALRQDSSFTFQQALLLSAKFDKRYYRTVRYWQEEMERVLATGYSEGRLLGGRRYYARPPELSETVNFPIQRTAAEMMNQEMIELDARLKREVPKARIIIQLHDAIDVECPERDEEAVCRIVTEVMNRSWTFCNFTREFPIELKVARASEGGTWNDV